MQLKFPLDATGGRPSSFSLAVEANPTAFYSRSPQHISLFFPDSKEKWQWRQKAKSKLGRKKENKIQ